MYTVLIQAKRTMDTFQQFYPLFAEAVESGRMGVCQWVESGDSVEAAVPELYDLINRKRIWRAVVVCAEHDEPDTKYPADIVNPFDFYENTTRTGITVEDGVLKDCEAPLIRLCHMLGGIPAPEPVFEATLLNVEDRVPAVEYHPVNNELTQARKKAYADWCGSHDFRGIPPAEIVLVKVRKDSAVQNDLAAVKASWQVHTEADSSEFWKRNLYPHNCRFLVYNMEQRGVMRQQRDLFKLWTAVLLLAENEIDPNVLQAHRLYRLELLLDENALAESFQTTVNKLNMARYQLEKSLAKDEQEQGDVVEEIPDYTIGVPVSFQLAKRSELHFQSGDYGLTGGIGSADMEVWERYSATATEELRTLLRSTDRTLDKAANRLRERCGYADSEVVPLNRYQVEDFEQSLEEVYQNILQEQEALPAFMSDIQEELAKANEDVRAVIRERMTAKQAIGTICAAVAAIVVCLLPGLMVEQSRVGLGIVAAAAGVVLVLAGLLVLLAQKRVLIRAGRRFQECFQTVLSEISHNGTVYSGFLCNIASHIRGRSYLNIMKEKQLKRDSVYYFKRTNLKAIEIFLSKISLWSTALHVDVDLKSVSAVELADDGEGGIDYDALFSFDEGKNFAIPLNSIGVSVNSPYGFVERLEIEREEIYDDAYRG